MSSENCVSRIEEIIARESAKFKGQGPQETHDGIEMVAGGIWISKEDADEIGLAVAKAVVEAAEMSAGEAFLTPPEGMPSYQVGWQHGVRAAQEKIRSLLSESRGADEVKP